VSWAAKGRAASWLTNVAVHVESPGPGDLSEPYDPVSVRWSFRAAVCWLSKLSRCCCARGGGGVVAFQVVERVITSQTS
jgi:hypothetical protein